jgi:hypothetical protein
MSKHLLFRQHEKLRADRYLHASFAKLAKRPSAISALKRLLQAVWQRSDLLQIDRHRCVRESIEALHNLSLHARAFVRKPESWPGCSGRPRAVVSSLAAHLLGAYPMPAFLGSVWFGDQSAEARRKRRWYLAHAHGQRFRSLDLPMKMTRRMEHHFLNSPTHLSLEQAMRRAELLSLGASEELIRAVLATHLGEDLSHGEFWRSVMTLLVNAEDSLSLADVGPIVDFLHCLRIKRVRVDGPHAPIYIEPIEPDFSVRGRTLASLLRLVERWHLSLRRSRVIGRSWMPSIHASMRVQERARIKDVPALFWEFVELTNSRELRLEGGSLRHCVATYDQKCVDGRARIWSLRARSNQATRSVITIEVCPKRRAIVQARGMRNRMPAGRPLEVLAMWARREQLAMAF